MKARTLLVPLAMALVAAPRAQQSCISPKTHVAYGGASSSVPFGEYAIRYQQIYDAGTFSTGDQVILCKGLAFRGRTTGGHALDLEVRMATGAQGVDSDHVHPDFDANMDLATRKTCFARKTLNVPTQSNFTFGFPIKFDANRVFSIVPASGRAVVVEIIVWTQKAQQNYRVDSTYRGAAARYVGVSQLFAMESTPGMGSFRVLERQQPCEWNFQCGLGRADNFHVGSLSATLFAYQTAPSALVLCWLGTRRIAAPIPGTTCSLVVAPEWILPVHYADATGLAIFSFPIPANPALGNLRLHMQCATLRPHFNAAGFVTSNAGELRIGTGQPTPPEHFTFAHHLDLQVGLITEFLR